MPSAVPKVARYARRTSSGTVSGDCDHWSRKCPKNASGSAAISRCGISPGWARNARCQAKTPATPCSAFHMSRPGDDADRRDMGDRRRVVQAKAERDKRTPVMADDRESVMAQRGHQADRIGGHRVLRVVPARRHLAPAVARRSAQTTVCRSASGGATCRHARWLSGNPCSNSTSGPVPDVATASACKPGGGVPPPGLQQMGERSLLSHVTHDVLAVRLIASGCDPHAVARLRRRGVARDRAARRR
jgi:hypothetical protein